MAIKIGGTEVISNSRKFTVDGAAGVYNDFQPIPTVVVSNVTGSYSIDCATDAYRDIGTSAELSGNVTFALTNLSAGKQFTMFVDTSTSTHNQAFSIAGGTVLYPNDTEPTWTDARYWLHRITCWSNDTASVISTSWSDGAAAPLVNLDGAISAICSSNGLGGTCRSIFAWGGGGTISTSLFGTPSSGNPSANYDWLDSSATASDYQVQFTYTMTVTGNGNVNDSFKSGTNASGSNSTPGPPTSGTWYAAEKYHEINCYDAGSSPDVTSIVGTVKIRDASTQTELASQSFTVEANNNP